MMNRRTMELWPVYSYHAAVSVKETQQNEILGHASYDTCLRASVHFCISWAFHNVHGLRQQSNSTAGNLLSDLCSRPIVQNIEFKAMTVRSVHPQQQQRYFILTHLS